MEHSGQCYRKTYWLAVLRKPRFPQCLERTLISEKNDAAFHDRIADYERQGYRVDVVTEIENDYQARHFGMSRANR